MKSIPPSWGEPATWKPVNDRTFILEAPDGFSDLVVKTTDLPDTSGFAQPGARLHLEPTDAARGVPQHVDEADVVSLGNDGARVTRLQVTMHGDLQGYIFVDPTDCRQVHAVSMGEASP